MKNPSEIIQWNSLALENQHTSNIVAGNDEYNAEQCGENGGDLDVKREGNPKKNKSEEM